jgi:hypothetical protein
MNIKLSVGKCYHVQWQKEESLIIIVKKDPRRVSSGERFFIKEIASSSALIDGSRLFDPLWVEKNAEISDVDKNDLPLYVGWKFVSPELTDLIAGIKNEH